MNSNNTDCNYNEVVGCSCGQIRENSISSNSRWKTYTPIIITLTLFVIGILLDFIFKPPFFTENTRLVWYVLAYLPVALPAFKQGWDAILDVRPDSATVIRNGSTSVVAPKYISIDEIIQVKAGEKVPLDGILLSSKGSFNTSALTGESVPRTIQNGEQVLAGMVNTNSVVDIRVKRKYEDSSLARVLKMVQDATTRKSKTELFIRKFARLYTPIVFALAFAITFITYLFVTDYQFSDWLYRALVFLVISCPCALVISIPLSYFGGIGAASRNVLPKY